MEAESGSSSWRLKVEVESGMLTSMLHLQLRPPTTPPPRPLNSTSPLPSNSSPRLCPRNASMNRGAGGICYNVRMKIRVTHAVGLWGLAATGLFAAAVATGEEPGVYAREAEAFLAARWRKRASQSRHSTIRSHPNIRIPPRGTRSVQPTGKSSPIPPGSDATRHASQSAAIRPAATSR